jgi:hypothetical protein
MDLLRESPRLQLIGELPELVEIDTRFEPKGVRYRLRRRMALDRLGLTDAGAELFD